MNILKPNPAYAIICLMLSFLHFSQAATYTISIDYHHSTLKYTDTKSTITLTCLNVDAQTVHQESWNGIYPISTTSKTCTFTSEVDIPLFQISTDGEDAFFIDQVVVMKDGRYHRTHDMNDAQGWCLSTDPNDTYGSWNKQIHGECQKTWVFEVSDQYNTSHPISKSILNATLPTQSQQEVNWVYQDNEARSEINAEGLGRCYDIRYVDPINWSNESLRSGQRASVIQLVRDNSKRPARHNNRDYVTPKGVVFTSEIIGDSEAESKFASTSFEFETTVLSSYRADVGVPKIGSAKASAAFKDISQSKTKTSSLYAFSKMYKQFYKLDLFFDDPAHQHHIDARFWQGVKDLGQGLSAHQFIEKFGTHYAATTYYGGNFFQRRTVTQSEFSYYESHESEFKADVAGTIKKVNFDVGTTQGLKNEQGQTEQVKMSAAKIYTVGGDLNQYRPDLWAKSVLKNLAVVKVRLHRLSTLLTAKNFPNIPNIQQKQQLLHAAIFVAEQEALAMQSAKQSHQFFTKKDAKFKLTVTHMKCKGHGAKETGGNSEYFGAISMGLFGKNGQALKTSRFFNRSDDKHVKLALNQSYDINKSISYTVRASDLMRGYITVYGYMKEKDMTHISLSTISKHAEAYKIYFREALDHEVRKKAIFTSKYGDKVEVHYKLRKL